MWCLVSQANASRSAASSVVIQVRVANKATGQQCLDLVCQKLGIVETDYFGLQVRGARGQSLWLNLRNEIRREVSAPLRPSASSASADGVTVPAIRFQLRVKFWVPPHLLLQESTRHQFYLHGRVELLEGRLTTGDVETAARICALAAQAELGDASASQVSLTDHHLGCLPGLYFDEDVSDRAPFLGDRTTRLQWLDLVRRHHQSLKGMKASVAEYWMLKELSNLDGYGTETFGARWTGADCTVAVSPHGVAVATQDGQRRLSIPFSSIEVAANHKARFLLQYADDALCSGSSGTVALKLATHQASVSLYRAITEKHAFYSCETVRSAVTSQFVRDLKGTIASFFNENTDLGKKYVFDIQRTCREVYDNARRVLYQNGGVETAAQPPPGSLSALPSGSPSEPVGAGDPAAPCADASCKILREQLARVEEALMCRICMDADIEVAFCPCGHSLACLACAQRCRQCPICRAPVTHTQTIFLPLVAFDRRPSQSRANCQPAPPPGIDWEEVMTSLANIEVAVSQ